VPAAELLRSADGRAPSLAVAPWADQRPGTPGRRLGGISGTVFDIQGTELTLIRDATAVVDDAVREQLRAQGLAVLAAPESADLRLEGSLQTLTLNVAARDERRIVLRATLRRQRDGQVLWSGAVEERNDRFAGVSGNNRRDLETYLGEGISKAAAQLATAVREHAVPLAAAAAAVPAVPAPPAPAPPAVPAAAAPVAPATPAISGALGQVLITTVPPRVKVYVDDVYHGLTPLTLELPAGTSQLHFKREGYRSASEKVAVRRGASVELELKLAPE
jgi:hypothetical protein